MANVNLVKSIYTSGIVTSLGELAAADTAEIPGNAQIDGLTASKVVATDTNKKLVSLVAPSFRAHKNGSDQGSITSSNNIVVTFSTTDFDTNSNFASSKFTPTVAGTYLLLVTLSYSGTPVDNKDYWAGLRFNGSTVYWLAAVIPGGPGVSNILTISGSLLFSMNGSTDYFEVIAFQSQGSDQTIKGAANYTNFSGFRIMP